MKIAACSFLFALMIYTGPRLQSQAAPTTTTATSAPAAAAKQPEPPPPTEEPRAAIKSDNSQWGNLRGISRSASMTFVVRNRGCFYGRIHYISDHGLGVYVPGERSFHIGDDELLFVGSERVFTDLYPADLLYSWRSSWDDLQRVAKSSELKVYLKDKKTVKGKVTAVDANGLTLEAGGTRLTVAKSDITRVDNLQNTPLSDAEEGVAREAPALGVLFPGVQSRKMHLAHRLSVRLYDTELPEMNYPVSCSNR